MNVNKLILEISYLFCCIGPIVILIIRNINDLMPVTFGILSIIFLIANCKNKLNTYHNIW